jgi:hypothetical protein
MRGKKNKLEHQSLYLLIGDEGKLDAPEEIRHGRNEASQHSQLSNGEKMRPFGA